VIISLSNTHPSTVVNYGSLISTSTPADNSSFMSESIVC
jgi:hypothetical protein